MNGSSLTFTYTADRRLCLGFAGAFGAIMLVEASSFALLVLVLVHDAVVRITLLAALGGGVLYAIGGVLLSPLWTRHRLTPTSLDLRYGRDRLLIPRTAIAAVREVDEHPARSYSVRARYDERRGRLVAVFAPRGQVLLHLDPPQPFVARGGPTLVGEVLFNVDHRDALLTALGRVGAAAPSPDRQLPSAADGDVAFQPSVAVGVGAPTTARGDADARLPAIHAEDISRRYDDFAAVDHLTLRVVPGEIYGFLGPNGAGKTTTIKMLVGLLRPTTGRIVVAGHDVQTEGIAAKAAFGYVPDRAILYERLTGREFLGFLAQLHGLSQERARSRIEHLLELLELVARADVPCGAYSFGMKRKLALAGALLHQPRVLILDEPLSGLDPRGVRRLKVLFGELAAAGGAILLSTHDLATAETVCHRVGIIQAGKLVAEGRTDQLRRMAAASDLEAAFLNLTGDQAVIG